MAANSENGPGSRSVYLITYGRANLQIVPRREAFAELIKEAFTVNGKAVLTRFVCSQESHEDGGAHYHMAVKLDRQKRWISVRKFLDTQHDKKI